MGMWTRTEEMWTQPAGMGPTLWGWGGDGDRNHADGWEVLDPMQLYNTCIREIEASMNMDVSMDIHVQICGYGHGDAACISPLYNSRGVYPP